MDRIILFDIDKTLFDRRKYLDNFYSILASDFGLSDSETGEVNNFYIDVKNEYDYFTPQAFLAKIYYSFPKLDKKLDYYFKIENLNKFLFEDSEILFDLKNIRIGIFSKGDRQFQLAKINKFESILEDDLIFIFHNKLENLKGILDKFSNSEIFIADDQIDVLLSAKDTDPSVKTILVDRDNEFLKVNQIDFKIELLSDIITILNESR